MTFKGGGSDTHKCLIPCGRFDTRSGIFAPPGPCPSASRTRERTAGYRLRAQYRGRPMLPATANGVCRVGDNDEREDRQPGPFAHGLCATKRFNPARRPANAGFPANSQRRCLLSVRFGDISRGFILLERHMGLNASRVWLDREPAAWGTSPRGNCLVVAMDCVALLQGSHRTLSATSIDPLRLNRRPAAQRHHC